MTMPAVVLTDEGRVVLQDRPPRRCGPTSLIEVDMCGICGSDLHASSCRRCTGDCILGHESPAGSQQSVTRLKTGRSTAGRGHPNAT